MNETELFPHPYDHVVCTNMTELETILKFAQQQHKIIGTHFWKTEKFPVNIFLDGPIVGWTDQQDRLGRKITFNEFYGWIKKQEEL